MNKTSPLVTVLTPVFNGEKFLAECINTILAQTYTNWEYVIVNNCSTDKTLEIAQAYAKKDKRIRVISNKSHVGAIANYNIAFRQIPSQSKYCKVVAADDWLYPECLSRMVQLAEEHPSVAIVGAYTLNSKEVNWVGLPIERSVFKGSEVCRLHLLGGPFVIGPPTSVLFRADIIRSEEEFYHGSSLGADEDAYYRVLKDRDFGFVHQILSYERLHEESLGYTRGYLRGFALERVAYVATYGRSFLSDEEYNRRYDEMLKWYYFDVLASAFIKGYPKVFWNFHKDRLNEIGIKFDRIKFLKALVGKVTDLLANPKQTVEKAIALGRGRAHFKWPESADA
jgi:glycosyltransferase involved in cell wall biosynthesis